MSGDCNIQSHHYDGLKSESIPGFSLLRCKFSFQVRQINDAVPNIAAVSCQVLRVRAI